MVVVIACPTEVRTASPVITTGPLKVCEPLVVMLALILICDVLLAVRLDKLVVPPMTPLRVIAPEPAINVRLSAPFTVPPRVIVPPVIFALENAAPEFEFKATSIFKLTAPA